MKKFPILLLSGLLLAAPVGQLSARTTPVPMMAEESLDLATVQRVLDLAAPQFGISTASLQSAYEAGRVTITYQGPIRGGHRYLVGGSAHDFIIVDDFVAS